MWKLVWIDKEKLLRESFRNVKKDVLELTSQLNSLEEELRRLQELTKNIRYQPKEQQENKTISESQPSLSLSDLRLELRKIVQEELGKPLKHQNSQAGAIVSAETEPENSIATQREQITAEMIPDIRQLKKDKLKEDLIKSYERNRKDIVKQQILGEATKGDLTKINLRDIVVDQKNYCSKASFYRYVEELELQGLISYKRKKGKDIIEPLPEIS